MLNTAYCASALFAPGRGFILQHISFVKLYESFAHSHFYLGAELGFGLLVVQILTLFTNGKDLGC